MGCEVCFIMGNWGCFTGFLGVGDGVSFLVGFIIFVFLGTGFFSWE